MRIEKAREKKKDRKRNRLIFRTIILALLVAAVVFALITNAKKDNKIYKVGDKAPDFQLQQINKNNDLESIRLSDLKGKGVMLNFWATYCKPCEKEMPYMEKLYPQYKDKGIEIIAVSLDATEAVVHQFIDKYNLTFPIPHDTSNQVNDLYKIGPIPTTYFVNPEGIIVEKVEGALTLEQLEGYLKQIQPDND
ncbi:thiol-disulfide oxidoreductase ResA [Pseudogracilibacillus auburnensis]|uniref:thiol-disulfide oxidoreductase ResA n=1 Tax=Pseudogracilibacillus auburnensis TaxID=1494959 RepID=UPI001A96D1AA|nr:thiol-disulfide oxidoreductase ResA [Pseudogracilibacillus auburnensis]MBO1002920.1 thiol-disulfide oxidoreductase ResA [Pseudogracilibacillus auburnensis]